MAQQGFAVETQWMPIDHRLFVAERGLFTALAWSTDPDHRVHYYF